MTEDEKKANSQQEQKEKIRARYKGVDKTELEFIPAKPVESIFEEEGTKRVAAYCRVSTDDPRQTSSYELQKNHYEDMIQEHPGWELVGIYADEGISGTSLQHRDEFNRMMEDCRAGKIDLIVTKSVSRFARNIVDCIAKQRELANMNPQVGVLFETEHIYSLDGSSEMMMAVLAAAAQEESHTKSEIMNISIEQRFSRGIFLTPELLGYDKDEDGNLVINEEEAKTVKLCYYLFISGFSTADIAKLLTEYGRKTKLGNTKWTANSVSNVLQNERHCGDVLSRKTFTPNYLDHKHKKNLHDRNQYRQLDHHEPIVSREVFNATQKLLAAHQYRRKGYPLPTLGVVDDGILKGFVPVNRSWKGFSEEDYQQASLSAYEVAQKDESNMHCAVQSENSHFNLDGYEIVRAQFFSTRDKPAITISQGRITFSSACLKKFENVEYVELLFNSVEGCLAIRPCEKDNANAIKWATIRNGKMIAIPRSCRGFSDSLFHTMNWNVDCRYRMLGQFHEEDDAKLIIFDLTQTEVLAKKETEDEGQEADNTSQISEDSNVESEPVVDTSEKKKRKKTPEITLFPQSWTNHFGDAEGTVAFLERVKYHGDWDVLRPAKPVEGLQDFTAENIEEFKNEAFKLMKEMSETRWMA